MKQRLFLLPLFAAAVCAADKPKLPEMIKLRDGRAVGHASLLEIRGDNIKLMHDGGVSVIPITAFLESEQKLLGFEAVAPAPDVIPLPNPFKAGKNEYIGAHLSGVEPDGIRISHQGGAAKIGYELLDSKLQDMLGGFNPTAATAFREQERERQAHIIANIESAKNASIEADNKVAAKSSVPDSGDEMKRLLADPNIISDAANVLLTGGSSGGMRRNTTWQTDYGSYNREDQSFHDITVKITSRLRSPQRVVVEILWITRSENGGPLTPTKIGEHKVLVGANQSVSVTSGGKADRTDDKYVALGIQIKTGSKYVGWSARARNGRGQIIAVTSSMPYLDAYGWK